MIETYFGLSRRPFLAIPDVASYYPSEAMESARQSVSRCLQRGEGVSLIFGEPGVGKTLLLRLLGQTMQLDFAVASISNGRLKTPKSFLQQLLFELQQPFCGSDENELRLLLWDHMRRSSHSGVVLLIDEAQTLALSVLEEIRLLLNCDDGTASRFRVALAGTSRLEQRLTHPKLLAFNQWIVSRSYLEPFSRRETSDYIFWQTHEKHISGPFSSDRTERIPHSQSPYFYQYAPTSGSFQAIQQEVPFNEPISTEEIRVDKPHTCIANGNIQEKASLFEEPARKAVYELTQGVPRLINQLCDHTLLFACEQKENQITEKRVRSAWSRLQQIPESTSFDRLPVEKSVQTIEFSNDNASVEIIADCDAGNGVAEYGCDYSTSHLASSKTTEYSGLREKISNAAENSVVEFGSLDEDEESKSGSEENSLDFPVVQEKSVSQEKQTPQGKLVCQEKCPAKQEQQIVCEYQIAHEHKITQEQQTRDNDNEDANICWDTEFESDYGSDLMETEENDTELEDSADIDSFLKVDFDSPDLKRMDQDRVQQTHTVQEASYVYQSRTFYESAYPEGPDAMMLNWVSPGHQLPMGVATPYREVFSRSESGAVPSISLPPQVVVPLGMCCESVKTSDPRLSLPGFPCETAPANEHRGVTLKSRSVFESNINSGANEPIGDPEINGGKPQNSDTVSTNKQTIDPKADLTPNESCTDANEESDSVIRIHFTDREPQAGTQKLRSGLDERFEEEIPITRSASNDLSSSCHIRSTRILVDGPGVRTQKSLSQDWVRRLDSMQKTVAQSVLCHTIHLSPAVLEEYLGPTNQQEQDIEAKNDLDSNGERYWQSVPSEQGSIDQAGVDKEMPVCDFHLEQKPTIKIPEIHFPLKLMIPTEEEESSYPETTAFAPEAELLVLPKKNSKELRTLFTNLYKTGTND